MAYNTIYAACNIVEAIYSFTDVKRKNEKNSRNSRENSARGVYIRLVAI